MDITAGKSKHQGYLGRSSDLVGAEAILQTQNETVRHHHHLIVCFGGEE